MLHACSLAGCKAHECLYVGDARRDIEAGHNAGMPTLVALFGYIGSEDDPASWGADAMVEQPDEILHWLDARNVTA
jgi:phosphoglycolate phosphatase